MFQIQTYYHTPIADTLAWSAAEGQMVQAASPSLERGNLHQLVRHPSKESKAEETRKKGKMITIKKSAQPSEFIYADFKDYYIG